MATQAFINGQPQATVSVQDRGLAYGDGLFETMLLRDGQSPLWHFHQSRLQRGLKALGIRLGQEQLQYHLERVHQAAQSIDFQIHKLIVTRGEGERGYCPELNRAPTVISLISPYLHPALNQGVKVHICQQPLYGNPSLAGLKTLNQLPYVLASQERLQSDFVEGLLFSEQGLLIEATARNIFIVKDHQLLTPSLDYCGVAGVMRQWIIEALAPRYELKVTEASINLEQLKLADEVFLCNSIHGIWPLTECWTRNSEILTWPVGENTRLLQVAVHDFLFG